MAFTKVGACIIYDFFSGIHEMGMKKVLLLQRFNRVFAQMKQTIIIKIAVNHEFAQCHSVCI